MLNNFRYNPINSVTENWDRRRYLTWYQTMPPFWVSWKSLSTQHRCCTQISSKWISNSHAWIHRTFICTKRRGYFAMLKWSHIFHLKKYSLSVALSVSSEMIFACRLASLYFKLWNMHNHFHYSSLHQTKDWKAREKSSFTIQRFPEWWSLCSITMAYIIIPA